MLLDVDRLAGERLGHLAVDEQDGLPFVLDDLIIVLPRVGKDGESGLGRPDPQSDARFVGHVVELVPEHFPCPFGDMNHLYFSSAPRRLGLAAGRAPDETAA
ncbi:MAG: hypothetical protein ACREM3_17850 [Candidatus Rokuibacteriota bacterium]